MLSIFKGNISYNSLPIFPNFNHPEERNKSVRCSVVFPSFWDRGSEAWGLCAVLLSHACRRVPHMQQYLCGIRKRALGNRIIQIHWLTLISVKVWSMTHSHRKRVYFVTQLTHNIRCWAVGYSHVFWKCSYFKFLMHIFNCTAETEATKWHLKLVLKQIYNKRN